MERTTSRVRRMCVLTIFLGDSVLPVAVAAWIPNLVFSCLFVLPPIIAAYVLFRWLPKLAESVDALTKLKTERTSGVNESEVGVDGTLDDLSRKSFSVATLCEVSPQSCGARLNASLSFAGDDAALDDLPRPLPRRSFSAGFLLENFPQNYALCLSLLLTAAMPLCVNEKTKEAEQWFTKTSDSFKSPSYENYVKKWAKELSYVD